MKTYITLLFLCAIIAQIDGHRRGYLKRKISRKIIPVVLRGNLRLCNRKAIQANETDFIVCASDGNTFTNRSELCENLKANRSLSVVHPGECGNCSIENVCLSSLLPKKYAKPQLASKLLKKFLGRKLNISSGNKTNETNAFNIPINNSTCQKLIAKCEAFRDNGTIIKATKPRIVLRIKHVFRKGRKISRRCRGRGCFIAKIKKIFIKGRKFKKTVKNQTVPTEIPEQTPTSRNATIIVPDVSK